VNCSYEQHQCAIAPFEIPVTLQQGLFCLSARPTGRRG